MDPILEKTIHERSGLDPFLFMKQKVEQESLYDYEIAEFLNADPRKIGVLRKSLGLKRVNGFKRRFELKYGKGAVERFKQMVERPGFTLTRAGKVFGFSREYARQVYLKLYGRSYTEFHRRK